MKELNLNEIENINGGSWNQAASILRNGLVWADKGMNEGAAEGPEVAAGLGIIGFGGGLIAGIAKAL